MQRSICIGYDSREVEAFAVCRHSLRRMAPGIPIHPIVLDELRDAGAYTRPTSRRVNKKTGTSQMWDDISDAAMSTEFAISRFLTPRIAGGGWALFMDCDVLARDALANLFAEADPTKAVMCVQHPNYAPAEATKMDGQMQQLYARKNWSSVMLFNVDHPSNKKLTVEMVNTVPGRDLHRFCWLRDREIGALDPKWNFLVGVSDPKVEPGLVHFTSGGPWFEDYRDVPYADEWRNERSAWLAEATRVNGLARTYNNTANGALADAAHF